MTPRPGAECVRAAASKLGRHPQDHGWRELYRLLAHGLSRPDTPHLHDLAAAALAGRPTSSDTHLVTLLGIAVKSVDPAGFPRLVDDRPVEQRLATLEGLLSRHRRQIDQVLTRRQNSFTGARRFLVPQVLLAAYFARQEQPATFADLGTGLGVLPRQLNCKSLFDRYAPELTWPGGRPAYQPIPLAARYGVDRGPFPDQRWVQSCYGPSPFYAAQFRELTDALERPEVRAVEVGYHELDLTDRAALGVFLRGQGINAVNLSYTLYELDPASRAEVLDTLAGSLHPPGFVIVTEPNDGLARPGCTVSVRDHADPTLRRVCTVSDGHFTGVVRPLEWFDRFVARYPIRFERG
ncbi:MAG: hypothetical protein GEV12_17575 [Micromonosporaceae bacterium]|nr:hypothetical protein [Micromonosporaceae bacterium]